VKVYPLSGDVRDLQGNGCKGTENPAIARAQKDQTRGTL
jgi:hypothetical protein